MLRGTLIAESLRIGQLVDTSRLTVHSVRRVGPLDGVLPEQPDAWTFIEFTAPDADGPQLAATLADAIDPDLGWYCDFRSDTETFVVFADHVFRYPRGDAEGRARAASHARHVGLPDSQIDWPE